MVGVDRWGGSSEWPLVLAGGGEGWADLFPQQGNAKQDGAGRGG